MGVYWFPVAAVTNYHKLSGLKEHKFITALEVRSPEIEVFAEPYSFWKLGDGGIHFLVFPQVLEAAVKLMGPSWHRSDLCFQLRSSFLTPTLKSPSYKDPVMTLVPPGNPG